MKIIVVATLADDAITEKKDMHTANTDTVETNADAAHP